MPRLGHVAYVQVPYVPHACFLWQPAETDPTPRGANGSVVPLWSLVRTLRRRARLDQRAFAERVGLSKSALARIERGHTTMLPVAKLLEIVDAGGCSVVVLDSDGRPLRHTREDNAWIDRAGRRTPAPPGRLLHVLDGHLVG